MNSEHGNYTDNTSFVDILKTLKQNIFRTMQTAELAVVREDLGEGSFRCEFLANQQVFVSALKLQDLDVQVNDVVLIVFTGCDYRASLKAFKNGDANTSFNTQQYHQRLYGVITGLIYRKVQED